MHNQDVLAKPQRSEEIQHIVDRMPTKFGYSITYLVLFVISTLFLLGWMITYHDVATGSITINTENAPVKIITNSSGRMKLTKKTGALLEQDEIIGYVKNAANYSDVVDLKKIATEIKNVDDIKPDVLNKIFLAKKYTLGELSASYYQLLNTLNGIVNFQQDQIYAKQERSLMKVLAESSNKVRSVEKRHRNNLKNNQFYKKFTQRDSFLLSRKIISEAEFNRSELSYLASMSTSENSDIEQFTLAQEIENTKNSLQRLSIEKSERFAQLRLEFSASLSDLKDKISLWEERYLLKSPFEGRLQYQKFWVDDQYVAVGTPLFTIISVGRHPYGQINLPIKGSGKVVIGQDVIIKLDNYPYMEYGSIQGKVKTISLTTNIEESPNGRQETYLITVSLPYNLVTNYGKALENRTELRGIAEIITNERKLIQRIFDNLRYLLNKK